MTQENEPEPPARPVSKRPYKIDVEATEPSVENSFPEWLDFSKDTPATKVITLANVLVFGAMAVVSHGESLGEPTPQILLAWGADFGQYTLTGEYWRVLSNCFVHVGALHIIMNMYALWQLGPFVERLYGSSKFTVLYLLAGVGGSLLSLYFSPSIVSAGASGAIMGLYGALLAFFKVHAQHFPTNYLKSVTRTIGFLLVFNLIFGFAHRGIDNAAHIGGFLTGLISGFALVPSEPHKPAWQPKDLIWTVLLMGALFYVYYYEARTFAGLSP